jgi:deferrochelatase/peroxidase EfeB
VTGSDRAQLVDLLRAWTIAAAAMTSGSALTDVESTPAAPPLDTGEALDLPAANLTVTFGFGPSLFEREGRDRFGLASRRPALLRPLGPLPGEEIDAGISDGDLCVQACADDPQVAFHAIRNLARIGRGKVVLRWMQLGFGRTSSTTKEQSAARNLHGFKDGTNNIDAGDARVMADHVWVGRDERADWMADGTYLVARKIRMLIETWDRSSLTDQEQTVGRFKNSGAPLTGHHEHDVVDLAARGADGAPVIAADAHVRIAAPSANGGVRILRRGYSYTDGVDPASGELDAGLFFLCFQRDPHAQFAALQRRIGASDALTEYIKHIGSGLFAVPGGIARGRYVGQRLLEA